jgi:hypothetical protein
MQCHTCTHETHTCTHMHTNPRTIDATYKPNVYAPREKERGGGGRERERERERERAREREA